MTTDCLWPYEEAPLFMDRDDTVIRSVDHWIQLGKPLELTYALRPPRK